MQYLHTELKSEEKQIIEKIEERKLRVAVIGEVYWLQCLATEVWKSYLDPASQHALFSY